MKSNFISYGAIFGALAVMLGAFGAHGLKSVLTPEDLAIYQTAVEYQFYHALALVLFGLCLDRFQLSAWPGWMFVAGTVIFSGSLYVLVLMQLRFLGAITPIGGVAFIVGWIGFAVAAFKKSRSWRKE